MSEVSLEQAIAGVPAGRWAAAVSGGADSVALLRLLHERQDVSLHVVHLDHETRGTHSAADAEFVRALAQQLGLPATIAPRSRIEPDMQKHQPLPPNLPARYRAARMALFRQVVRQHNLDGVVLGHHVDDQAETILHRLLRGSGPQGRAGMVPRRRIDGLLVLRPLLLVCRERLRAYLRSIDQPWREDPTNLSPQYLRNRLRHVLQQNPQLTPAILDLGGACRRLTDWLAANAPVLEDSFESSDLHDLPPALVRHALRRWLARHGAPANQVRPAVIDRLEQMVFDAASPARQHFPGGILVTRRRGRIGAEQKHQGIQR